MPGNGQDQGCKRIQKDGDDLYYKSGGGITLDSDNLSEYQEMLDKVYIPV